MQRVTTTPSIPLPTSEFNPDFTQKRGKYYSIEYKTTLDRIKTLRAKIDACEDATNDWLATITNEFIPPREEQIHLMTQFREQLELLEIKFAEIRDSHTKQLYEELSTYLDDYNKYWLDQATNKTLTDEHYAKKILLWAVYTAWSDFRSQFGNELFERRFGTMGLFVLANGTYTSIERFYEAFENTRLEELKTLVDKLNLAPSDESWSAYLKSYVFKSPGEAWLNCIKRACLDANMRIAAASKPVAIKEAEGDDEHVFETLESNHNLFQLEDNKVVWSKQLVEHTDNTIHIPDQLKQKLDVLETVVDNQVDAMQQEINQACDEFENSPTIKNIRFIYKAKKDAHDFQGKLLARQDEIAAFNDECENQLKNIPADQRATFQLLLDKYQNEFVLLNAAIKKINKDAKGISGIKTLWENFDDQKANIAAHRKLINNKIPGLKESNAKLLALETKLNFILDNMDKGFFKRNSPTLTNATANSALGGVFLGASGGALAGALVGVGLAPFTLGLSIPVTMFIGTVVGMIAGAVSCSALGFGLTCIRLKLRGFFARKPKSKAVAARSDDDNDFQSTNARVIASAAAVAPVINVQPSVSAKAPIAIVSSVVSQSTGTPLTARLHGWIRSWLPSSDLTTKPATAMSTDKSHMPASTP